MVRGFCVGLGEFLTFSATVLMILVNVGQISDNTVARHLWLANIDATNFRNAIAAQTNVQVNSIYAPDQASPLGSGAGLRYQYYWGMYSECGGEGIGGARACSSNMFGNRFQPLSVLEADQANGVNVTAILPQSTFTDNEYLGKFSHAAFYLIFVGTVLAGLSFLTGFLAHRFAFLISALLSLGAAVCLAAGAAIWTALLVKSRQSINDANLGLVVNYGYLLWFTWASFGATLVAFVPLVISCCVGRPSKY